MRIVERRKAHQRKQRAPYAHAVAQRDETQQRHVGDGIHDVTRARGERERARRV
jgi:hypothetical protein